MLINRSDAIKILTKVGVKEAEDLTPEELKSELGGFDVLSEKSKVTFNEEESKVALEILEAIEEEEGFKIVNDVGKKVDKSKRTSKDDGQTDDSEEEVKSVKPSTNGKSNSRGRKPGRSKGRGYWAGHVIRKLGLDADKEDLINLLEKSVDKPNKRESNSALTYALNVVRGYVDGGE